MAGRVLIIDDDEGFAKALERTLRRKGHDVLTCGNAAEARETFPHADADVVVLDYHLPDADGLKLLEELRPNAGGSVFLMATAFPNLDVAVEAMRRGAFDFVAKDRELSECMLRIERGAEVALLRRRMAEATRQSSTGDSDALIGESAPMVKLRARLNALAGADDTTVLLVGETGTGKGVLARQVHAKSGRTYDPFVAVDCTTIASTLVESELFGHEKGSFSGATNAKMGRVEAAGRGTLFLDEIGELELPMQAKLLRLLEEREFTRVGSTRTRKLEARIVTATNRNLAQAVAEGWFRADLRYRLEVFVIEVPPLRARGDDIYLLTAHFARDHARALGKKEPRLHQEVITALATYPFPGNVRELRNMVEQAVLLSEGAELSMDDFPVLTRVVEKQRDDDRWARPSDPDIRRSPSSMGRGGSRNDDAAPAPPVFDPQTGTVSRGRGRALPAEDTPTNPMFAPPHSAHAHPDSPSPAASLAAIRASHASAERTRVVEALSENGGNVSAAARALGLSRYQLIRRLDKYGLR